jgi:hypothetical protein
MLDDKLQLKAKEMLEKIEADKQELLEKKKERKVAKSKNGDDTQSVNDATDTVDVEN